MAYRTLFTSESVTEGHPDKIADQISDAILDAVLAEDPLGRVACETLVTTGMAMISGEITTKTYVDFPSVVRNTIREIGYTRAKYGFDSETCAVISSIDPQSPDIAQGVDTGGAGDQGLMFGFACRETEELMPLPIQLAHKLVPTLTDARKANELDFLRPDGKSQVTIEYEGKRPIRASAIVISTQHSPAVSSRDLRDAIIEHVIKPTVPMELIAYAIGVADPVSVYVDTFGTGRIEQEKLVDIVRENFQMTPRGIMESLRLRRPIFKKTAACGHFGRSEPEFTWEATDKVDALRDAAGVGEAVTV